MGKGGGVCVTPWVSGKRLENCALFGRRVSSDVLVVVVQDRVQCQLVKVGHKLH